VPTRPLEGVDLRAVGEALGALGADAWLLWDFRKTNPVAGRLLGVEALGLGTRRLFVVLPRAGPPVAIVHRIEAHALAGFPGEVRAYAAWGELSSEVRTVVSGRVLAMEVSEDDAVPYLDRVPRGVVELVESLGGRVVSSANLVTRFASCWTAEELVGHRRAATALAEIATDALRWAGAETARGAEVREVTLQRRVMGAIERMGLTTTEMPIAAFQQNAALPHYEPHEGRDRRLDAGQVVLLDLWARVGEGVFADQTWMGFTGRTPDAELRRVWDTVRGARDGVVEALRGRWPGTVTGAELDDVARGIVRQAGYGEFFVHRTGHSIDRELHGSGPHLDNFETADRRLLAPRIGFSVEPGIYLPGRFGVRSEINVFLNDHAPEITPPVPQQELLLV
jgi:Xaa-Pro dipeptidase